MASLSNGVNHSQVNPSEVNTSQKSLFCSKQKKIHKAISISTFAFTIITAIGLLIINLSLQKNEQLILERAQSGSRNESNKNYYQEE